MKSTQRRLGHHDCKRDAAAPRAGEIFTEIGVVLLAHGALVLIAVRILHACGIL
ncbi:MAG: hypothetical protein OJF58_001616 [Enhydrobacter sp.]|jgi:hypothetical protein|nr:MAG: hypothetical protein OJF58_001616 [Enhydrobacter sp.]